jgi:hypothetical protein
MKKYKDSCPDCDEEFEHGFFEYYYKGRYIGKFEGDRCNKCGTLWFTEAGSKKIDEKAKYLGIWGKGYKDEMDKVKK